MSAAGHCDTCRFREPDARPEYPGAGQCHRFPPAVHIWTAGNYEGPQYEQQRPWVTSADWCGEYQEKQV